MKNILKIIAVMVLLVTVTGSIVSAEEKVPDAETINQEQIGAKMTESEIKERINEIDVKGSEITRDERFERIDLKNQLIEIEKAETESYKKVQNTLNSIGQSLK